MYHFRLLLSDGNLTSMDGGGKISSRTRPKRAGLGVYGIVARGRVGIAEREQTVCVIVNFDAVAWEGGPASGFIRKERASRPATTVGPNG